ncbi:MAG: hypothetical protein H7832_07975 [Magnetococcus sp. DMHC-6]
MVDFLEVESLIIARLTTALGTSVARVAGVRDLAAAKGLPHHHPAVHLLLDSANPVRTVGRGRTILVEQRWVLLVLVKSVQGVLSGEGAREAAGPLISQVIQSMAGWKPEGDRFMPFQWERSNYMVEYAAGGFIFFPLLFSTQFVLDVER